jgi:cytochrome c oxidase assembly protein Cox11
MNKKGQCSYERAALVLAFFIGLMVILFFLVYHQVKIENNLCKSCGYNKSTDVKYIMITSTIIDRIECDNRIILDVRYPKTTDKWGEEQYDWNKPEVNC